MMQPQTFHREELRTISVVAVPLAQCTLSTLVADTGETQRTLNHWTDVGVIRTHRVGLRRGRGNKRVYLYGERKFVLIASAIRKINIPHLSIKAILDELRHERFAVDLYDAHIRGGPSVYAVIESDSFDVRMSRGEPDFRDFKSAIVLNLSDIFSALT